MKLCTGCNKHLPLERFKKSDPDFQTRDGHVFKCFDCVGPWRLGRDPVTKKVCFHEGE